MVDRRCPSCGHELPETVVVCTSCECDLPIDPRRDVVAVYRTADAALLPIVRSVLRASGIRHAVQGEGALGLFPLGATAFGLFKNPMEATILVPAEQAEEARQLLDAIERQEGEQSGDEGRS
jgi:hypothetical protein